MWIDYQNSLQYTTPLFMAQLCIVSLAYMVIKYTLKPLRQASIISQVLSGILLGPSILGRNEFFAETFFPQRGIMIFETVAGFGLLIFLFGVGVEMETRRMFKPSRTAVVAGIFMVVFSSLLTVPMAVLLTRVLSMNESLRQILPIFAVSQCTSAFPSVCPFLKDRKIINTDPGRIAISISLFSDLIGMSLAIVNYSLQPLLKDSIGQPVVNTIGGLLSALSFVSILAFVIRPLILKLLVRLPQEKPVSESYIMVFFILFLACSLVTEIIGQHFAFGALAAGIVIPPGPPLGSTIIRRLEYPIATFSYPTFLTNSGLKTNIFFIQSHNLLVVCIIVLYAAVIKVVIMMVLGKFLAISTTESVVIGLMLNAKGPTELILFNLWSDVQILNDEEFSLAVTVGVIGIMLIQTPLIVLLMKSANRHTPFRRRTIQNLKREMELRILVAIKDQESVPSIVNLLEASNASEESPVAVIALILVELVGQAAPILIAHQYSHQNLNLDTSSSAQIINALRQYEFNNETNVSLQPYTAVSQSEIMHDDICRLAVDQNATIVILPFHKHWAIDGSIGTVNRAEQHMNSKVIEKSPCSVAVLVDKGILTGSLTIINTNAVYKVAMIYIGGPDDAEALCYGARMARHTNVTLTVLRYLLLGCDNARERRFDNDIIEAIRCANVGNHHFVYQEQVVKDGEGFASSLRNMENIFDLLMVGRTHQDSPLLEGIGAWIECSELGGVGDFLASPDFKNTASVLVVQQQRFGGKLINRAAKPVVNAQDFMYDNNSSTHLSAQGGSSFGSDTNSRWELPRDRSDRV
ncbi:PREDICTED: cation/H(+) antiporter 15-like [Ipomoea nil]|uniref:cation/H(+) antiporter 15-like n=1 Tax=Ipomoea nil TaxID=35883 RepID=UPI0009016A6E|nr:PREDICTED: cation/H(+) antiporter 15-like [Ipomoea nil]